MRKCNADDHPYCTYRVQDHESACTAGHAQKISSGEPLDGLSRLPTYAELTARFSEPAATSGLYLHFSGYDPRAAGGRQMFRLELRGGGGQSALQNITQIEVQLRSDLIASSLSKHHFVRTLSGQWRPLLIAFSSKNKEHGQYQMEVALTHMHGATQQRRWTCSTIILVPPADTSLTEIHRVFLASHKNVRVLADDGSIAKLSGLNSYAHGNMDIEISARNAALTQVELTAPMGKYEISMGTIAWDEELIEESIEESREESLQALQKIAPGKVLVNTIAASLPLKTELPGITTSSASLISKATKIRLLALDSWVLGRLELQHPSADILLAHSGHSVAENAQLTRRISARHAIIRRTGEGAEIIDVSRYGVLLDGVVLEKSLATALQPGMQIELCASVKGIACLRVKKILPHLIILQRTDGESEFFYLLTPETKPSHLSHTLPVALPDSLPQLFHRDGSFWHIDPLTKQESMLSPSASLSGMRHIPRGSCYHNETYQDVRGFGE